MIPLRKGAQYEELRKLGKGNHLVKLKTSPQARKKWPGLGNEVTARLLTVTRKGKVCHLLTSMTDAMRFPEEKWRICTVIAGKSNWDTGR